MRSLSDDLSDYHQGMLQAIEEHGVHLTYVAPADGENGPAYAYTVGLWHTFQHPEVVLFGLDPDTANELLNAVSDEIDDDKKFAAGEKHQGLLVDYAVRFLDVPKDKAAEYCDGITWAYEGADVPILQLVWPDKEKRWPWEDGVRQGFKQAQLLLGSHES